MKQDKEQFAVRWSLDECRVSSTRKSPAPHQTAALAKLNEWYATKTPQKGAILALPTGGGKTFTAAHFLCSGPLSDGHRVLWLAHTHHLLEQAFRAFDTGVLRHVREPRATLDVRVVSGTPGHYAPREISSDDDIVIATLQTVTHAHREKVRGLVEFLKGSGSGKLFVVFDEAHHAPAPSYRRLLEALRADHGATLLGLTATPTHSNEAKRGWLAKLFPQGVVAKARASDLMAAQVLAKPNFEPHPTRVRPEFSDRDYQKWLGTFRDIPEHIIEQLARNGERNELIASTYAENRKKYGKTIIFTDRWFQCEAIVEALAKRKVKAEAVYAHVDARLSHDQRQRRDRDENAKILERFRKGELDVLVNVRMLTEGTDLPGAESVFLTRQTTSRILQTQMIGRALRGPKFGGTAQANIVLFMDDWQQAISFADFEGLDGRADDDGPPKVRRTPIELISIDLVKKLARQMDSGVNRTSVPFVSLLPAGWFHVSFDARRPDSDDVEVEDHLVLVFDDERAGFDCAIADLLKDGPQSLPDEQSSLESWRERLDILREEHLGDAARDGSDLVLVLFQIARHVAQAERAPVFFPYEARNAHDLDAIARDHDRRDLRMSEVKAALEHEYARKDRFWRTIFPRFEQFRSFYDACLAGMATTGGAQPTPRALPPPAPREPTEEEKRQVIRRDGGRCLACGGTRNLQADHILSVFHGGGHDLDNLQTLCKSCNLRKGTRTMRFTSQRTSLAKAPEALEHFDDPDDAGNRDHWERFLRRTMNFTFQCAAVSRVTVGGRGDSYYNWTIELVSGNDPSMVKRYLPELVARIQAARSRAGKPGIESLTIRVPGGDEVSVSPSA